jgi:hypothetical protein
MLVTMSYLVSSKQMVLSLNYSQPTAKHFRMLVPLSHGAFTILLVESEQIHSPMRIIYDKSELITLVAT